MPTVLPLVLAALTALSTAVPTPGSAPSAAVVPVAVGTAVEASGSVPAGTPATQAPGATRAAGAPGAATGAPGPVAPRVRTIRLEPDDAGVPERSAAQGREPGAEGTGRPRVALAGPPTGTEPFGVVGVSWTGALPAGTAIQVRVLESGSWGGWQDLEVSDCAPDPGTPEASGAAGRGSTEPLIVAGQDGQDGDGAAGGRGVQVRVLNGDGALPGDLAVNLVDAGSAGSGEPGGPDTPQRAAAAGGSPTVRPRSAWGADESLRSGTVTVVRDPGLGIVHHTAGSSSYSPAQVPGIIRGIYAYHTKVRKWNDIGYNYLVDRFGRIWEGRHGGLDLVVQGAHAKGFNSQSFGVAVLGDFESARPPRAALTGLAEVLAWKMSQQQIDPTARTTVTSLGNPGYRAGTRVTRWTISGHREVYPTACPGRYLYAALPSVRSAVRTLMAGQLLRPAVTPSTVLPGRGARVTVSARVVGGGRWGVTVRRDCDGRLVRSVAGRGPALSWSWPLQEVSGAASAAGPYRITLTGTGSSARASDTSWTEVLPAPGTPVGTCPVTRLTSGPVALVPQGVRARTGPVRTLVVVATESVRRPEQVTAGALARALGAGLVVTPSGMLASSVASRIRGDGVDRVLLVGADGTWGPYLMSSLRALGVTIETLGGADRHEVIEAVATRALDGRTAPTTAVLVDPADPVPAIAGAVVGAVRGLPVLSVGPRDTPEATARFLQRTGAREVIMAGTGALPGAAVRSLLGQRVVVTDLRGPTRAGAVVSALDSLPASSRRSLAAVPPSSTGGLEALLASALGRPLIPVGSWPGTEGTDWLRGHSGGVGSLVVGAGPSQVSTAALRTLASLVRGGSPATPTPTPAPPPTPTPVATASVPASFEVTGSGYGHGVGMSQYGAYGLALRGAGLSGITAHYYRGSALSAVDDAVPLRVNLLHQARMVTLGVSGVPGTSGWPALRLRTPAGGVPVARGDTVSVVPSGTTGVKIFKNGRNVLTLGTNTGLQAVWTGTWAFPGSAALALLSGTGTEGTRSGRQYRYGTVQLVRVGNRLEAVNVVSLGQHYLRGVAEMPSSWGVKGRAALQAQAVAARTYALRKYRAGLRADCQCHLYDSARDQVFAGWSQETGTYGPYWASAVSSTARTVLSHDGALAEALYFSSSAGRTENAEDVWGTAVPYLTSVADPYSLDAAVNNPMARWSRTLTQSAVARTFGLPDVVAAAVSGRTAGGSAATVSAVSRDGRWASITGARLRSGLGLPASWVSTLRPAG